MRMKEKCRKSCPTRDRFPACRKFKFLSSVWESRPPTFILTIVSQGGRIFHLISCFGRGSYRGVPQQGLYISPSLTVMSEHIVMSVRTLNLYTWGWPELCISISYSWKIWLGIKFDSTNSFFCEHRLSKEKPHHH